MYKWRNNNKNNIKKRRINKHNQNEYHQAYPSDEENNAYGRAGKETN